MTIGLLIFSDPKLESFASVERLTRAAEKLGHKVVNLYEPNFSVGHTTLLYDGQTLPALDVIIARPNFIEEPGLHGYVVQALLKEQYRVINGLASFGPVKNKIEQIGWFDRLKIPYPTSIICKHTAGAVEAAWEIGFPVILKVAFGAIGSGVFYAEREETLRPIVDYLQIRDRNPMIVQQFVGEAKRKDLRVFVVGTEIVASMQRSAPKGDVRANASHGGIGSSVELREEERLLAMRVAQEFGLEIAGVDLIRSQHGPLVLEVNANPGFAELERATGVDVAKKIIQYAASARPD